MQSHIIFNNYITDTNSLNLGYIEIWGVDNDSISNVTISLNNVNETVPFIYDSSTQVCDYWKPRVISPSWYALWNAFQMLPYPAKPLRNPCLSKYCNILSDTIEENV
jgi:hypothetical protein